MKRLLINVCAVSALTSCIKLADLESVGGAQQARETFMEKFPTAVIDGWGSRLGYFVAEFTIGAYEEEGLDTNCVAWFDENGKWYLTESSMPYADLPQTVLSAFEEGEFADCTVKEVYCLDTPDYVEYAMLIEGNVYGYAQSAYIYYRENGRLHISIVNPRADYTYGDYILSPICHQVGAGTDVDGDLPS